MKAVEVKKDIYWVGALDPDLRIFDIVMYTPYGTTYNSYVVKGSEKTAVFETVKEKFFDEYVERLRSLDIDIKNLDYIIVDHTEPDHAGSVAKLLDLAPNAKVVGSPAALKFLKAIANKEFEYICVGDGDTLSLGNKTLKFVSAPFLHWPDSIYTYVEEDNVLITCDSFGSHYCTEHVFNDLNPDQDKYMEALKYYFNVIMGPFKSYVLSAIEKIKYLNIDVICPGHGPVLRDNPSKIVKLYKEWSTENKDSTNEKLVVIPYVSAYGYTENIANKIAEGIKSIGDFKVSTYNVIYSDINEIIDNIEKADGVLFGSPTINSDALKPIMEILISLSPIVHGKKLASAFGSYGWSGEAVPHIESRLKELKMCVIPGLKINFKPSEEDLKIAYKFGESFAEKIKEKTKNPNSILNKSRSKQWKCVICGIIMEGVEPPDICPVCGADSDQFIEVKAENVEFKKENDEKFIIIGNGAAGFYAADAIRKRNSKCSITMISSESVITYYRPQLSDYLSEELTDKDFYLASDQWYKENNIELKLNTCLKEIKHDQNKILLEDNSELRYDKLILANGSYNFIPPLNNTNKEGIFTLKYLSDAKNLKNYMKTSKKALVVGGGLLGLEAAWEMKNLGLQVTVVEFAKKLMSRQLDNEGSELFYKLTSNKGVDILLDDCVDEILGDGKVTGVKLKSGKQIDCDIILFSIGIRPNVSIVEKSDIKINKGIVVNEKMETSIPNIYACGDVAELNERVYGNWPAAIEMGKVAGSNAVGDETYFSDFVSSVIFSAFDTELFSCGNFNENNKNLSSLSPDKNSYKKLFFDENKLIGGILIGDTKKSAKIITAIQNGKTMEDILKYNILL